jgi:23S rRNA (guanine745-N1)-methyltransferase
MIDAGPDHLRELREIIYPTLKPPRSGDQPVPEGFATGPGENLRQTLTLNDAANIADLLAMTPHLYRATPEGRARAATLETLTLTVDVRLSRFFRI